MKSRLRFPPRRPGCGPTARQRPSARMTAGIVRSRIWMSSHGDQRSMYSRSISDPAVELRQVAALDLPQSGDPRLHREAPAVPDVVRRRPRRGSGGRGPTRLISPTRTFQSCGSSSRLDRRRKRPIARDPRIGGHLERVAADLVLALEVVEHALGVGDHRAEFDQAEPSAVEADALLAEEDRPRRPRARSPGRSPRGAGARRTIPAGCGGDVEKRLTRAPGRHSGPTGATGRGSRRGPRRARSRSTAPASAPAGGRACPLPRTSSRSTR